MPKALDALDAGKAGIVVAVTGSGKSVAIAEIIAQHLLRGGGLVVVTTSSRRLVDQLATTFGERVGRSRVGRYFSSAKEADRPVIVACNNSAVGLAAVLRGHGREVALWIADEAHRTEASGLTMAAAALRPKARIGFTATAFRSDLGESLQLFDTLVYRYGFGEALRDGVVVPWRVVAWTGDEVELDDAVVEMIRAAPPGPGVVNATSIADATAFAERLTSEGIPAAAIHSEQSTPTQEALLAALRRGDLRCIVYPSLLSEGADFPWLRWMCLRRDVKARVRFLQEVGRVLRTDEGKTEAVILDPLGLFNRFSLTYDEDIGEKEREDPGPAEDEGKDDEDEEQLALLKPPKLIQGADRVAQWARQLFLAAELDRILAEDRPRYPVDRGGPATNGQLGALRKMAWAARWLPPEHAAVVRSLAPSGDLPNRGAGCDLLDVLGGVAKRKAPWAPSLPVSVPGADDLASAGAEISEGRWCCAGAERDGRRAVVIVKGRKLIETRIHASADEVVALAVHVTAARWAARKAGAGAEVWMHDEGAWRVLTGAATPRHPSVRRALDWAAPQVTYKLCAEAENPAARMARSALRAQGA